MIEVFKAKLSVLSENNNKAINIKIIKHLYATLKLYNSRTTFPVGNGKKAIEIESSTENIERERELRCRQSLN